MEQQHQLQTYIQEEDSNIMVEMFINKIKQDYHTKLDPNSTSSLQKLSPIYDFIFSYMLENSSVNFIDELVLGNNSFYAFNIPAYSDPNSGIFATIGHFIKTINDNEDKKKHQKNNKKEQKNLDTFSNLYNKVIEYGNQIIERFKSNDKPFPSNHADIFEIINEIIQKESLFDLFNDKQMNVIILILNQEHNDLNKKISLILKNVPEFHSTSVEIMKKNQLIFYKEEYNIFITALKSLVEKAKEKEPLEFTKEDYDEIRIEFEKKIQLLVNEIDKKQNSIFPRKGEDNTNSKDEQH